MLDVAELVGTVLFAISGTFAVAQRPLDWFGAVVVGVVTAVGGGTVRGLVLGITPVFWVEDEVVLIAALAGAVVAIPLVRLLGHAAVVRLPSALLLADAAGLALFAVVGAEIALDHGFGPGTAIVAGLVTGVGGGVIRDVLAGQTPLILRSDIYATAALAGVAVYVGAERLVAEPVAAVLGGGTVLVIRLCAIYRGWSLPAFGHEHAGETAPAAEEARAGSG